MNTLKQLDLQFVQDLEADCLLAQVIRVEDDAVVAQVPAHLAEYLKESYDGETSKGVEHFEACKTAIGTMFHYPNLINKKTEDERIFTRARNLREGNAIDYRDLKEGDVLIMRSGKRNTFKKASLKGSGDQSVLTLEFMDGTILKYTTDYNYRSDQTLSVCDLMTVERKEWSKC